MTLRPIPIALGLALSVLVALGFHTMGLDGTSDQLAMPIAVGAFVHCALTISGAIGLRFESERVGILVSTASGLFCLVGIGVLVGIGMLGETPSALILVAIVEVVFVLVVYGLHHSGQ